MFLGGSPPEYPQQVYVSSTGPAAVKYGEAMGVYIRLEGEEGDNNGRPVWADVKDEELFLFFSGIPVS